VQVENLSGWGNYPLKECKVCYPFKVGDIGFLKGCIPRGMGRSYADQSISDYVIKSRYINRFLGFDQLLPLAVDLKISYPPMVLCPWELK